MNDTLDVVSKEEMEKTLNEYIRRNSNKHETDQLDQLFTSLAKAQAEIEFAFANSANPFLKSKYAKLDQIIRVSRDPFAKNGLSIIQRMLPEGDKNYLYTRICHASGQWIESKMLINPAKNTIQDIGSYITYLRRYQWMAMAGIATAEDECDDDGEANMNRKKEEIQQKEAKNNENINPSQVRELEKLFFDLPDETETSILNGCQINELGEMKTGQFDGVKKHLLGLLKQSGKGVSNGK